MNYRAGQCKHTSAFQCVLLTVDHVGFRPGLVTDAHGDISLSVPCCLFTFCTAQWEGRNLLLRLEHAHNWKDCLCILKKGRFLRLGFGWDVDPVTVAGMRVEGLAPLNKQTDIVPQHM